MGNQPASTMCCADTTGHEVVASSSFEGAQSNRGRPRLLRRLVDALRPLSPRRDQIAAHQHSNNFLKNKFASPQMEMDPLMETPSNDTTRITRPVLESQTSLLAADGKAHARNSSTRGPPKELRSLSSMSTQSEVGERVREARSECVTRRFSYCSAREGVEEEREPLEPEGNMTCTEAME